MSRLVRFVLVLLTTMAASGAPAAAPAVGAPDAAAQTILHLLDYVGVDYPEAVENGKVRNEEEYKEMLEFTGQIVDLLKSLPAVPRQAELGAQARALARRVEEKAPPAEIAAGSGKLRWAVIEAYAIEVAPRAAPDPATGAKLYQSLCASCHGADGRGDGPAGAKLEPAPSNFRDAERMAQRSAYGLYNTITLGVDGTGMASYRQLAEAERWALAFHTAGYATPAQSIAKGEALWKTGKAREAFPDIGNVAKLSANEVRERYGEDAVAVQAYLLANPAAIAQGKPSPIAFTLTTLEAAVGAYRGGERERARQLAITAYLEGFELAEASLANVDAPLVAETEREMMALRALIQRGAAAGEVERQHGKVVALLGKARERLSADGLSPWTAFAGSLLILLREGLEAILVLAAIIAFLVKAGRRDALPWVHAGWGAAIVMGLLTWIAATWLIGLSGANRETTEGVTALLACAMLAYVGIWLHGKSYAHAWERFIRESVGAALGKGTLWAMAGASFLAVYRELFEIVLFYEALWVQAGASGQGSVLAGVGVAAVMLTGIGWAIFRYSVRLPIGPFFALVSILLALLAVVFAGNGIAALQEAGLIDADIVPFASLPSLGVHPTVQTLAGQALVIAILAAGFFAAGRTRRPGSASTSQGPGPG
ncbi:MAG: cytochrome c/FTR1 family iron permease [Burkholderiales bacterium]|nr:cytochrome c/FTR1 family iron permease [Burkholderiales bacterium]